MSTLYRVTLVQLNGNATALTALGEKLDLGQVSGDEIQRLAGNLLKLDLSANSKAEPGIIVHRGEKGWRIAVRSGRLCMHKSTSLFDEFWTVENPAALAGLPPFAVSTRPVSGKPFRSQTAPTTERKVLRSVAEVSGLFAVAIVLIMVGFKFGLPQRRLTDLPPDLVLVTSESEKASVFGAVAGTYTSGKNIGNQIVTIAADGRVSFARVGKDGKPTAPQNVEQARAARKGNVAVVITSRGNYAEFPPDKVNVSSIASSSSLRRLMN